MDGSVNVDGAPKPSFVIDPSVAKSVLAAHELHLARADGSSSSSSSNVGESSAKNHQSASYYANLEKPTKPTRLLRDALTNANGDAWARQRNCVCRAFAVDKVARVSYANFAVEKALELIDEAITANRHRVTPLLFIQRVVGRGNNSCRRCRGTVDVRAFSREVAIHAMVNIVFGEKGGNNETIVNSLREMIYDTLEPRRDEERSKESAIVVKKLDGAVRGVFDHISTDSNDADADERNSCLAKRLLLQYNNKQTRGSETNYLTFDEVVGNAHSALLAGIQTISTTLAGALLHLAETPRLQKELKEEGSLSGKDVVHEMLRILPPVAGLPRKPVNWNLEIPTTSMSNSGGNESCTIKKGDLIIIDLLAFAHAQVSPNGGSTLEFDPRKEEHTTQAAPWGMGKRRCPAGIISTEFISSVIEAIAKKDITWTLANPKRDSVIGHQQNGMGWLDTISYRPTLSYSTCLLIRFCKQID